MSVTTQPEDVASYKSCVRFRRRYLWLAIVFVVVILLSLIGIQSWKPPLNAGELRLVGIWTWQDSPGKLTIHYRDDGTMRYLANPSNKRTIFTRWRLDGNMLVVEYSPRNSMNYLLQKLVIRSKFGADPCRVEFNADGTVSHLLSDGSTKVLIPWNSELGDSLKKAE